MAALVAVGAVAVFAPVWFFGTVFGAFACDGDGGVPYAARDSTVGRLCELRENDGLTAAWLILVLLALVIMVVTAVVTVVHRKRRPVLAGLVVSVLLVGVYAGPFLFLDTTCSGSDQSAYERWTRDPDRPPRPPADCERY